MNGNSRQNVPRYINRYYPSILAQLRHRDCFFDDSCENGIEYMGSGSLSSWERDTIDYVLIFYKNGTIKWEFSVPEFLELLKRSAEHTKLHYPQHFEEWNSCYQEVEHRLLSRWSGLDHTKEK